jgi:hypothetical protein
MQADGASHCIIFRQFALRNMTDVGYDAGGMGNRDSVEERCSSLLPSIFGSAQEFDCLADWAVFSGRI